MPRRADVRSNIIDVQNNDDLFRRIHPKFFLNENGKISSAAFKYGDSYLSVDIAKLTTAEKSLGNYRYEGYRLTSIVTGYVRSISLEASHYPVNSNYAHGRIDGKITKSKARKLAKSAILVL